MTKKDFYNELKRIGVDITSATQMKVWSVALMNMAKDMIANKTSRCELCYYAEKATVDGVFSVERCSNNFCPVKNMPDSPGEVIEKMFRENMPLDFSFFFEKYVKPIVDQLIEKEEEYAKQQNNPGSKP